MFNMTLLYMNRNIPLQAKILFGYMMLMAVIISMAAILFHEHARLRKIEADTYEIRQARRDISEIHRNIVSDCSTTSCVFDFLLRCTPL